jgi:hypothetical protein
MIENLIMVASFGMLIAITYVIIKAMNRRRELKAQLAEQEKQAEAEYQIRLAKERATREEARKFRAAEKARWAAVTPTYDTPKAQVPPRGKETTVSYAPSPTQSVNSYQDNFMSDMATAMVINTLLASGHDSQSGFVTENRSTGKVDVKVNESSWGFDDSDSRKSISSSMDTSSSWSSSDSSSSSSSDSGPSSDW